jgi:hypothetical protein
MKQSFAFYHSSFDSEMQAQAYPDAALVRASPTGKQVSTEIVDVLGSNPGRQHWTPPRTIECVTVDAGAKKESMLNSLAHRERAKAARSSRRGRLNLDFFGSQNFTAWRPNLRLVRI